jgi:hypothetical protein
VRPGRMKQRWNLNRDQSSAASVAVAVWTTCTLRAAQRLQTCDHCRWKCCRNLVSLILSERDSRCDRNFLVATNSHNRFCPVPVRSIAGSLSDTNPFRDAIAASPWNVERLAHACIA